MDDRRSSRDIRFAREAEEIRRLLLQHGGHEDPSDEDPSSFKVDPARRDGAPHHVGGFLIDPWRQWPPQMRKHAATLRAHGYEVSVREFYDGEILEVRPPARRPRASRPPARRPGWAWLRKLLDRPAPPGR